MTTSHGQRAITEIEIDNVVRLYQQMMARFEEAAGYVEHRLRRELRSAAIHVLISSRAKHPEEVRAKIRRKRKANDPRFTYLQLCMNLNRALTDLAGVRVVVYDPQDEDRVCEVICNRFRLADLDRAFERKHEPLARYRATHLLVVVDGSAERESLHDTIVEVQVVSVSAHVFNELEHDISYKDHGVPPTDRVLGDLEEVWLASRTLDGAVGRLGSGRRASRREHETILQDSDETRFTLERLANRPIRGDFACLHELLVVSTKNLTPAEVQKLGDVNVLLKLGRANAQESIDDVTALVVGLMSARPDLVRGFLRVAKSWTDPTLLIGPDGPTKTLKRTILEWKGTP